MTLYCLYDVKADSIKGQVFPFENDDLCKRGFASMFKHPIPTMQDLIDYPDDFYIQKIGTLDVTSTGLIVPVVPSERVCCLADLK